jgi:hypothetical protein
MNELLHFYFNYFFINFNIFRRKYFSHIFIVQINKDVLSSLKICAEDLNVSFAVLDLMFTFFYFFINFFLKNTLFNRS